MSENDYVVGMISCASEEEAKTIARRLIEARLAACAHIVPGITAIYRWSGNIEEDPQTLVVVKTLNTVWPELMDTVSSMHSDEVPEIIALPIAGGLPAYLVWIDEEVKEPDPER